MTQTNQQNAPPQGQDSSSPLALTLDQKIERSREYLEESKKIQEEINGLYEKLIMGFEMNLEGKLQRLALERDEILLSLGKSILSLVQTGVELKFDKKELSTPSSIKVSTDKIEAEAVKVTGFEGAKVIKYPTNYQSLGSPISQISQAIPTNQPTSSQAIAVNNSITTNQQANTATEAVLNTTTLTSTQSNAHPLSYSQQLQAVVNTESASVTIQQSHQGNHYYQQKTYSQQSYFNQNGYPRYHRDFNKDRFNQHQPHYQNHHFQQQNQQNQQNQQLAQDIDHQQQHTNQQDGAVSVNAVKVNQSQQGQVEYLEKQAILEKIKDVKLSLNGWPDSTFNTDPFHQNTATQLRKILDKLGEPKNYNQEEQKQQILFIEEEIECCHSWSPWPRELQKNILTLIASRLRTLQKEDFSDPFDHNERYAKLFRKLTRFSSDHRPGFVQALSKDKSPVNSDWLLDEMEAWKLLSDWLNQSKD